MTLLWMLLITVGIRSFVLFTTITAIARNCHRGRVCHLGGKTLCTGTWRIHRHHGRVKGSRETAKLIILGKDGRSTQPHCWGGGMDCSALFLDQKEVKQSSEPSAKYKAGFTWPVGVLIAYQWRLRGLWGLGIFMSCSDGKWGMGGVVGGISIVAYILLNLLTRGLCHMLAIATTRTWRPTFSSIRLMTGGEVTPNNT